MKSIYYVFIFFASLLWSSCAEEVPGSDAYGNFEATVTTISAETGGQLLGLDIYEGQRLTVGQDIAYVDSSQQVLQKKQIEATLKALPLKLRNTLADVEVLENQKQNLQRDRERIRRLLEKKAATPKQLDDIDGQIAVLEKQMDAVRAQTDNANRAILAEKEPLLAQMAIINDQIQKSRITNPITGTVLTKLAEPFEIVRMGAPLYRIAQMDTMELRFYVDAIQLNDLKTGQVIEVLIDEDGTSNRALEGVISWISEEAEFTPKTIQTKKERVSLVYAVKALVANPSGLIRIGMPAEVNFTVGDLKSDSEDE